MSAQLATLKSQRAALQGQLSSIEAAFAKVRASESGAAEVSAKIAALTSAEVDAVREWTMGGSVGEPPAIDVSERTRLAGELARLQIDLDFARSSLGVYASEQRRVADDLAAADIAVKAAIYDALEAQHAREVAAISSLITEMVTPRLARAMALHAFLIGRAQEAQASGRSQEAMALFQRAERAGRVVPALDAEPLRSVVVGAMPIWVQRFNVLASDAPAGNVVDLEPGAVA